MSTPPKQPQPGPTKRIQMHAPDDLVVEYVNLVRIANSPTELVFDFAQFLPVGKPAQISSRIVMTPVAAKMFARALVEIMGKYESQYGEIRLPGNKTLADFLFNTPSPPEEPQDKEE